MTEPRTLRIYLSAPDDVRPERLIAERVLTRLSRAFAAFFHIEILYWERAPLLADMPHQALEVLPGDADLLVMILWARLDPVLADPDFRGVMSGAHVSATEFEFEDALRSFYDRGGPDLMLFQKAAPIRADLADGGEADRLRRDLDRLRDFTDHWFADPDMAGNLAVDLLFPDSAAFEAELEHRLYDWLSNRLDPDAEPGEPRWYQGRPYKGLAPYGLDDAALFFGRAAPRVALRDMIFRLHDQNRPVSVLVLGASGAGKSSLVEAGLLADLVQPGMIDQVGLVRHARLCPGDRDGDPLGALSASLLAEGALPELRALRYEETRLRELLQPSSDTDLESLASIIATGLDRAAEAVQLVEGAQARLVLVVDQLEEVFLPPLNGQRGGEDLVNGLRALANTGLVWVVAAMRSDYVDRLERMPSMMGLFSEEGRYHLMPPNVEDLSQMIRRPAIEAGLQFEVDHTSGASLEDRLLTDAISTMSLPLLSFMMDQLWRRRDGEQGLITFDAYEELGGLDDLLARQAEAAFRRLDEDDRQALPRVLRQLVHEGGGPGSTPPLRSRPLSHFQDGTPERAVVDALSTSDIGLLHLEGDREWRRVRIVHEVLLTRWPRLQAELERDFDDRRILGWLKDSHALFEADGRSSQDKADLLVPAGRPMAEAEDLIARRGDLLSESQKAYVKLSQARAGGTATPASAAADADPLTPRAAVLSESDGPLSELAARAADVVGEGKKGLLFAAVGVVALLVIGVGWWGLGGPEPMGPSGYVPTPEPADIIKEPPEIKDNPTLEAENRTLRQRLDGLLIAQSRYLLREAERALESGDGERAQNLVLASIPKPGADEDRPRVEESVQVMQKILQRDHQLALLVGHADTIIHTAWSPNGERIATAAIDGTVWVRDAATGAVQMVLRGHRGAIYSVAWSPDGSRIVTASEDGTARVWDGAQGKTTATLQGHKGVVARAFWSPKGRWILTFSNDGTARLWDGATGAEQAVLESGGNAVWSAAFSPTGRMVVTGSRAGVLRIWNPEKTDKPSAEITGLGNGIVHVSWSADGERLLSASLDGAARLHQGETGEIMATLQAPGGPITFADWSPDGNWIATVQGRTARLWNGQDGSRRAQMEDHQDLITGLAFSPGGETIATASKDGTVRLWDGASGLSQGVLRGHRAPIRHLSWSPDGSRILSGGEDDSARLWIGRSSLSKAVFGGHGGAVLSAAWSPNGQRLATASEDGAVHLWRNLDRSRSVRLLGHDGAVRRVAWSADGDLLLTASDDGTARIWDAERGEAVLTLKGHDGPVRWAEWSADGKQVLTASDDNTARLWDAIEGKSLKTLSGHGDGVMQATFSPGGGKILTISRDGTGRLWDTASGESVIELKGFEKPPLFGAWSPDGAVVAISGEDGSTRIWTGDNGTPTGVLGGHQGPVRHVSWSPDSRKLLTVGADHTARIWSRDGGTVLHVLDNHDSAINHGVWSRNGERVVTVANDGVGRIWNVETGQLRTILQGHVGRALFAAWSPDGNQIVTGSDDQSARVWDATQAPTEVKTKESDRPVPPFADGWGRTWIGLGENQLTSYLQATVFRPLSRAARVQYFLDIDPSGGEAALDLSPVTSCDRLAGNPYDPAKAAKGTARAAMRLEDALGACSKAVAAEPGNPRLVYQLGRAQMAAGQWEDAARSLQKALDAGHGAAAAGLAEIYYRGAGVKEDWAKATSLWRQAYESGMAVAGFQLAWRMWNGEGIDANRSAALTLWKQLAEQGDPNSHERLGRIYALGDGVFRDAAQAYFHYEAARQLFEEMGDDVATRHSQLVRANLARGMDPVTVFDTQAKVRAWRTAGQEPQAGSEDSTPDETPASDMPAPDLPSPDAPAEDSGAEESTATDAPSEDLPSDALPVDQPSSDAPDLPSPEAALPPLEENGETNDGGTDSQGNESAMPPEPELTPVDDTAADGTPAAPEATETPLPEGVPRIPDPPPVPRNVE